MGWIVREACTRLRAEIGVYRWDQWRRAAADLGLTVAVVDRGPGMSACLVDDVIIIEETADPAEMARMAWHEMAHYVLHAGNFRTWAAMPNGMQIVNKFERQAEEFAEEFPRWE